MTDILHIPVQPWRLNLTGEKGDIARSYSADRIAEGKPIREPFEWQMSLCVCVSISGAALNASGHQEFGAYRLIPAFSYNGVTTTYAEKTAINDGEFARSDPHGFYDAMAVVCGQHQYVMSGPEVIFYCDEPQTPAPDIQQLNLFEPQP